MATSRSIKINFQGTSRDVDLPTPATLAGLQAAVASTFSVELPARSGAAGADSDLSFTYRDPEGDDIVFDKDSELSLALRLCPTMLKISADNKMKEPSKPDEADKIYKRAARNLREYHGVPSMTPVKLTKTLALLKLHPRLLVKQRLAPKHLLLAGAKGPVTLGDDGDNNEDLAETAAADMVLMSFEDDNKEWNDGFVAVGKEKSVRNEQSVGKDKEAVAAVAAPSPAEGGAPAIAADAEKNDKDGGCTDKPKNVIHAAFVSADIRLRPREVMPLLLALGVQPRRFVHLGLVDGKELRATFQGGKHQQQQQRGLHSQPPGLACCMPGGAFSGRRAGGGLCPSAGRPCGPGRRHGGGCGGGGSPMGDMFFDAPDMPHKHRHQHQHHPDAPRFSFGRVFAGAGGPRDRRGGRGGPRVSPAGPFPAVVRDGAAGGGHFHGPPPGMMWMREAAPARRQGGGGGGGDGCGGGGGGGGGGHQRCGRRQQYGYFCG